MAPIWPGVIWLIAKVAMIFHSSLGLCSSFHQEMEFISPSIESWLNLSLALVLPECSRSDALSVPGPRSQEAHTFPFFSEMYLQFVFLESLFHYIMHKLEECVVIAMLFVVGLLFILMFSCPWQEIKSDFAVFFTALL